ncbi:hypothetical protein M3D75_03325 [Microbacterium enclense]|uniref:MaoC/PaaZ C-terminal domain-containing protein n=1 Tax=Microbacterium enclense TaxID=993073 RepID=UPI0021A56FB5|nr:MaoC/PaaZ C-terminal domain-containing protein [Microbacterium enclense]MCT2085139.1 hypothetical protein [Microbacterium enclense]
MSLRLDAVGSATEPEIISWNSTDAIVYALGVGAGSDGALNELAFVTENTEGLPQQVLPTFGVILTDFRRHEEPDIGDYDESLLVHAEQRLEVLGDIPAAGSLEVSAVVQGIYDKGSGALVVTEATGRVPGTDTVLVRSRLSTFIRGEGGFGVKGPRQEWNRPAGPPDHVLSFQTRSDQALLYRLSGDRNPLHTDPVFAERAGFPRPILHGLCTYGIAGRLLLAEVAAGDTRKFRALEGRFTAPVYPGDELSIEVWAVPEGHAFIVRDSHGEIVFDRGLLELNG